MPKSKRNKIVHLTQVKKKTAEDKKNQLALVEQLAATSKFLYIFDIEAIPSKPLMQLRVGLKDVGRLYAGKNNIAAAAFKNLSKKNQRDYSDIIMKFAGPRALLFSSVEHDSLKNSLTLEFPDFADKLLEHIDLELVADTVAKTGKSKTSVSEKSNLKKNKQKKTATMKKKTKA